MKSIFKSKTAWGAALSAIMGILALFDVRLSEADTAPVAEAFYVIVAFAFTIYGRLKAKAPVKLGVIRGDKVGLFAVAFIAICMLLATPLMTGCKAVESYGNWAEDNPRAALIVESFAQTALLAAVNEQAEEHSDIAKHQGALTSIINSAFEEGASEALVAEILTESILALYPDDPAARQILRTGFAAALTDPDATDGTPATFALQFLAAIAAGLVIFNQAMTALGKRKSPNPLTVRSEVEHVTKSEHDKHVAECKAKLTTAAISRKSLYGDVEALKTRTARLEEKDQAQGAKLDLLSHDFREMRKETNSLLQTIISKLKN
jgi:hypothetical protein